MTWTHVGLRCQPALASTVHRFSPTSVVRLTLVHPELENCGTTFSVSYSLRLPARPATPAQPLTMFTEVASQTAACSPTHNTTEDNEDTSRPLQSAQTSAACPLTKLYPLNRLAPGMYFPLLALNVSVFRNSLMLARVVAGSHLCSGVCEPLDSAPQQCLVRQQRQGCTGQRARLLAACCASWICQVNASLAPRREVHDCQDCLTCGAETA